MTEKKFRTWSHFLPESPFATVLLISLMILISCFDETWFIARSVFVILLLFSIENFFRKAWRENKPTHELLMDVLLVPYPRRKYIAVQILLITLSFFGIFFCMNTAYAIVHSTPLQQYGMGLLYLMIYGTLFLICTIASALVVTRFFQIVLKIIGIIYGIECTFTIQLTQWNGLGIITYISMLITFLIIWAEYSEKDSKNETALKNQIISKNHKGIMILSKMPMIKERSIEESVGYGFSFYWVYHFIEGIIRIRFYHTEDVTVWNIWNIFWFLVIITLISSINAIKKIYIHKNMLRIVPVRKIDLFSSCSTSALYLPVLLQIIAVIGTYVAYSSTGFDSFFMTSYPAEAIISALFLAFAPYSVYLMCYSIYASKNRATSIFLYIVVFLSALLVSGIINAAGSIPLTGNLILLIVMILVPHLSAYRTYRQFQNVHY